MTQVVASAPGKIFVAGEYAVLEGAPAICIAINRRARVAISRSETATHYVSAPGYTQDGKHFENITSVAQDLPLLAAVWDQFPQASQASLNIEIDTHRFKSGNEKLGIGSSAAAAVALTAALNAIAEDGGDVCQQAHQAHRALQNGRGSGADVASSYHGGVVEYRMHTAVTASLGWPADLHYALLWSGCSASTAEQLQKLNGMQSSVAAVALVAAAENVATAWRREAAQPVLAALREYVDALRHYDDEHRLGIFSAGHATLTEKAVASGLIYKPCGAGGGDFGIALADDEQTLHTFVAAAEEEGFVHSDLTIDPVGLVVERGEQ